MDCAWFCDKHKINNNQCFFCKKDISNVSKNSYKICNNCYNYWKNKNGKECFICGYINNSSNPSNSYLQTLYICNDCKNREELYSNYPENHCYRCGSKL